MSYLPPDVRFKGEQIWSNNNKLAGYFWQGAYWQEIDTSIHTMQHGNSKGMDVSIFIKLKLKNCRTWIIIDRKTGVKLSMPFKKLLELIEHKLVKVFSFGVWGEQYFVPLEYINATPLVFDKVVYQEKML